MTPDLAKEILQRHFRQRGGPSTALLFGVVALCGVVAGWMLHNAYWRSGDLDYTLSRAIEASARCKSITSAEQRRRVEDRMSKPISLFTLDDKMIAIDYVFDRIEAQKCLEQSAAPIDRPGN